MPFTAAQRADAYRFFAIAFAAAPGVTHLRDIELAYEGGAPTKQIVNEYAKKAQFKAVYADTLTDSQFAINLIENVVGTSASAAAKSEASLDVLLALRGGATRGDVVFQIFTNLASLRGDTKWGALAAKLDKQIAVAQYYSETLAGPSDNLTNLRTVLAGVDGNTDTSATALNARLGPLVGTALSGKVIDGYIRGASVFIDYNGNGIADLDIEKATSTTTDANGGYSMFAPRAGGTITASGGTNIDTGNPNTLVLKAPGGEAGSTTNRTITPITTLITQIASTGLTAGAAPTAAQLAAAESTVKASLGLTSVTASLLSLDPVAVANSTTASAADKAAALSVFKVGVQIAVVVKAAQTAATTEAAKLDAAAAVIASLVSTIATSTPTAPVTVDLTKTDVVTKVLSDAKVTVSTTVVQNTVTTATQVSTSTTTTSVATTQSTFEKSPTTPISTTPSGSSGGSGGGGGSSSPSTIPTTSDDSLTGTSGNDSINGLAGNDTINGNGGADVITGGPGVDTITLGTFTTGSRIIQAKGDSGSISASTLSTNNSFGTTTFDVISGFKPGDALVLPFGPGNNPAGISSTPSGTVISIVVGTYSSSANLFAKGSGTDLLVVYDNDGVVGSSGGDIFEAVVLVGAITAITGATGGTGGTGGTGVTGVVGG